MPSSREGGALETLVLVTDRKEIKETLRRALGATPLRLLTPEDWKRGGAGPTRDRLVILDLPTVQSLRERLSVAEKWPPGSGNSLLAVLTPESLREFRPSMVLDSFLVEPFSEAEAAARVHHILWRRRAAAPPRTLRFAGLEIDVRSYEVVRDGVTLGLTFKEYELLKYLASNPGRVCTRDLLLARVWGEDYYGGTRTVDVHIRRLRAKLGPHYEALIQTVRNVGYRFSVPEGFEPTENHLPNV
jgi:DNA-binding response OmpR family regulator